MEFSREESNRSTRREDEIYCLYSPCCYFCNKLVKIILKCLGAEVHDQEESPEKATEEREVTVLSSTRSILSVGRRPTRPPVSSGRGGQIN